MGTSGQKPVRFSKHFRRSDGSSTDDSTFLPNDGQLFTVMVGGFATVAGGVLAAYIGMGVDAGHLVVAQ